MQDLEYSKCLEFELTSDKRGYRVKNYDHKQVVANKIVVPKEHEGLPVIEIGADAFAHTFFYVYEIILPETLEVIGDGAFFNVKSVRSIYIPKNVKIIGEGAFFSSEFYDFIVDEENEYFCAIDGVLFTKDKTELVAYPVARRDKEYVIPEEVVLLRELSFGYAFLNKVVFSDNLIEIKRSAFAGANLTELRLPRYLQFIGWQAFKDIKTLKMIMIPATVNVIEHEAFASVTNCEIFFESPTDFRLTYDADFFNRERPDTKIKKSALRNIKKCTAFLTDKFCEYNWTAIRKSDKKAKE